MSMYGDAAAEYDRATRTEAREIARDAANDERAMAEVKAAMARAIYLARAEGIGHKDAERMFGKISKAIQIGEDK